MSPLLILLITGIAVAGAVFMAYWISRDPLHPLIFLGPMLFYVFVFRPWVLESVGAFDRYISDSQLEWVLLFKLAAVALFCLGCLYGVGRLRHQRGRQQRISLAPRGRARAYLMGCFLGGIALAAYLWMVMSFGGFGEVYSTGYGGLGSASGYILEAPLLSLAAVMLLAISRQGQRLRPQDVIFALAFISPLLIHGLLGSRRGPTFHAVVTLGLAWYVQAQRRPSLPKVLLGVSAVGLLLLGLLVYRSQIHLGSDLNFDPRRFSSFLFDPRYAGPGEDILDSTGMILTAAKYDRPSWGLRWLVTVFIRPIPKQFWPTKYEDVGFGWMEMGTGLYGYTIDEFLHAAGFRPAGGSAVGFDACFFIDFSWAGLVGCYLFGLFFAWIWKKERTRGGIWQLVLVMALAMSVHVPTQDVLQFFYRFLFVCIPSAVLWRFAVSPYIIPPEIIHPTRRPLPPPPDPQAARSL